MEEKREELGMNTNRISSIVMLSYHLYSCAIELEYSCLVIIMIYELAYSLCVMILTCSTSCLIIHMGSFLVHERGSWVHGNLRI